MRLQAADLFAGVGGTSTGMLRAFARRGLQTELVAVNHWPLAVRSHEANHPGARHLCEDLGEVDPARAVPAGKLHVLAGSPECTQHSRAKGGGVCEPQSRAGAWQVARWAEATHPDYVVVENVVEWRQWGPLTKKGLPDKRRKGRTFLQFLEHFENMGYHVRHDVLCSADYGDATTRERLFFQAWRPARPTVPAPNATPRVPASEVIDWSIPGKSIWNRKKPLADNTMRRIMQGLYKFSGLSFIMPIDQQGGGVNVARSMDTPLATITTKNRLAMAQPWLVTLRGTKPTQLDRSSLAIGEALPTITAGGTHLGLCQPFRLGQQSCSAPRDVGQPVPTVACAGAISLVQPTPYLVKFYGTGTAAPITRPLDVVTTRSRFGLGIPVIEMSGEHYALDILFRMLQPHELKKAMGFPEDYVILGTQEEQIKQIGNAVSVGVADALFDNIASHMLDHAG